MRLVSSLFALAVLGCCFGPSAEAPPVAPPAPEAPSPLSQALSGMGVAPTEPSVAPAQPAAPGEPAVAPAPGSPPPSVVDAPAPPPPAAPPPSAAGTQSPACAAAQADREVVRAQLREMRLTLGAETGPRLEAAKAQMATCDRDIECLKDPKIRMARITAYDNATGAQLAESNRLAQAELGSYDADQRVVAACGAP